MKKIPRGAPGTVPPAPTTPPEAPPAPVPTKRELAITPSQASLLASLQSAVTGAQEKLNVAVGMILGGHSLAQATPVGIGGTPESPTLVVQVEG